MKQIFIGHEGIRDRPKYTVQLDIQADNSQLTQFQPF
jgi:hypothetical protein